jgi:hypothetical protein
MHLDELADTRTITNDNTTRTMRRLQATRIRTAMLRRRTNYRIRTNVDTITNRQRTRKDRCLKDLTIRTDHHLAMRLVNDHAASRI